MQNIYTNKLIRFLFTGGVNTLFGYGVFALFISIGLNVWFATGLATILGIAFNYKSYSIVVFKERTWKKIIPFLAVYLILYLLNNIFIILFSLFGIRPIIAGLIVALPLAFLSFALNKKFVFKSANSR